MFPKSYFTILILVFSHSEFITAQYCQGPIYAEAVYSQSRLPVPSSGYSLIYDDVDSIFVFGNRNIYRFNLTSDELTFVSPLPVDGRASPLIKTPDGSFVYFANKKPFQRVFKFNPLTNSGSIISELPLAIDELQSFFLPSDPSMVYLTTSERYGAQYFHIYKYDLEFTCIELVKNITGWSTFSPVMTLESNAYVVADATNTFEINRDSLELTKLDANGTRKFSSLQSTVTTEKHVYLLGGYQPSSGHPTDGILRFSPVDNSFTFIRIDGMPEGLDTRFAEAPAAIYIQKLNRIYLFGGKTQTQSTGYRMYDEIWHIDVGQIE